MSLRRTLLIAFFVLSLAYVFSIAGSAEPAGGSVIGTQSRAVVFAVFGASGQLSAQMEPMLIIEGGQYKEPVSGGSDAEEIKRFSNERYRKGQKYRLLFGGAEAGTATVKKSDIDEECFRTGADVTLQTTARLNRNVMALATDSNSLGLAATERSRRSPTPAERTQALDLARTAFRQKGVAASLLPAIEVINLTAIDLDRDGKFELAGSFVASKRTRKQERYVLFQLAVPAGASYRAAISNYEKHGEDDIMSGASINAINEGVYVERLVEHLDLDGDGTSELVTTAQGLEGVSYYIYKKQGSAWNKIYEFGNYRCAF
ncbi:MAG: hypothetical protein ICV60_19530 [Pyrinomonadaceae bacterium]|nr:hypothetical protein [Pyrinomonadaceae bacterium]